MVSGSCQISMFSMSANSRESLFEVPEEVLRVLEANGEADGARADASGDQFVVRELAMGGAGGVDDEALGVADVGEVGEQAHAADEVLAGLAAAIEVEAEHGAGAAGEVLRHEPVVFRASEARVAYLGHVAAPGQPLGDGAGVADVAVHAQPQRLDPLQEQEGVERAHGAAQVPQRFGAQLHQVAIGAEGLVEGEAVIGRRRLGDDGEAAVGPVEFAGIHHRAADAGAVAAEELGGGMHDDVRAPVEWAAEPRRGEGVVHEERGAGVVGDAGDRLDVEHVAAGIADGLAEQELGLVARRVGPVARPVRVHEGDFQRELAFEVLELGHRAAVEGGAGDHMVARCEQGEQGR